MYGRLVSIVIPAHNEEKRLGNVLARIQRLERNYHVVVIDDGSTDRTREVARAAGVTVVSSPCQEYKTRAFLRGLAEVRKPNDAVVTMDADGQHSPSDIPPLVELLLSQGVDYAVACRDFMRAPPSKVRANQELAQKFRQIFPGQPIITDLLSGMRAFRPHVVEHLTGVAWRFAHIPYSLETEMNVSLFSKCYKFEEWEIEFISSANEATYREKYFGENGRQQPLMEIVDWASQTF